MARPATKNLTVYLTVLQWRGSLHGFWVVPQLIPEVAVQTENFIYKTKEWNKNDQGHQYGNSQRGVVDRRVKVGWKRCLKNISKVRNIGETQFFHPIGDKGDRGKIQIPQSVPGEGV